MPESTVRHFKQLMARKRSADSDIFSTPPPKIKKEKTSSPNSDSSNKVIDKIKCPFPCFLRLKHLFLLFIACKQSQRHLLQGQENIVFDYILSSWMFETWIRFFFWKFVSRRQRVIWTSINWAKARLSDEKFSWNRKMQPKLKMIFCSEILIGLRRRQKSRLSWNDYRSILFLTPFNQDIRILFTRLIIILFAKSKKYH